MQEQLKRLRAAIEEAQATALIFKHEKINAALGELYALLEAIVAKVDPPPASGGKTQPPAPAA